MKALIIGATGATGKDLINVMLDDPDYTQVVVFVRRPGGVTHPKLTEVVSDFDNLEEQAEHIQGDAWFSCLGTTLKTAGSKEKQWHVDYEIPMKFAGIAKRNSVPCVVLLSAYGASTSSNVFYSKMKGKLEEDMISMSFDQTIIFKPGLLLRKDTDRFGEKISAGLLKFLNAIGFVRRFKPMPTYTLAQKLAKAPKVLKNKTSVIELDAIFGF